MATRDIYSGLKFYQTIPPQIVDADVTGVTVDTRGYESALMIIATGAISSITSASYWVVRMQHADASALGVGAFADCAGSNIIGSDFSLGCTLTSGIVYSVFSDTNFESTVQVFGYRGGKRYVRAVIEEKGNLSTAAFSIDFALGHAWNFPVNDVG